MRSPFNPSTSLLAYTESYNGSLELGVIGDIGNRVKAKKMKKKVMAG